LAARHARAAIRTSAAYPPEFFGAFVEGSLLSLAPLAPLAPFSDADIGVLYGVSENDVEGQAWDAAFLKQLAELGWTDGRNVRVENRWTNGNLDRTKLFANELVQTSPNVLVAVTTPATAALQRETQTIPIIFTSPSRRTHGPR
jgi:putative ABC transport system substrate-binding protein